MPEDFLTVAAQALAEDLQLVDPRRLRPIDLLRVLNSTPLGEVLTRPQLSRHRERAGMRIGDDRTVDLLRYAAWLVIERHGQTGSKASADGYAAHKERTRERQLAQSLKGRDIGELPEVKNPRRRSRCKRNLRAFCEQYFPQTFHLGWSADHLKVIKKIETVVLEGGLFAIAMPRGSGKTSLCEAATLWALVYGHQLFVALVGPDEDHAKDRVKNLKTELESNDRLLDDFPAICYPIRCLDGIQQRRLIYHGKIVRVEFTAKRLILPDIPESPAAGAVVATAGITGQIRGLNLKRQDGTTLRPSLALIDDPQTDESAHSPSQCAQRERVINGAILGLAGPGQRIAAIMPCTVVRADDLADRILDSSKNPQWQSERTKMVYAWPTNQKLWDRYTELWQEGSPNGDISAATSFYRKNRKAMDAGAEVAWSDRKADGELSALQHAINLRLARKDHAFFAEYQNEPLPEDEIDDTLLTADQIVQKLNGHKRGEIPLPCTRLTAFIDVQQKVLFHLVTAWEDDFTGYVIDYGSEPDQQTEYFALRDVRRTLARAAPTAGFEGSIYAGLERLTDALLGREWRRDDGTAMKIDRCLIDANWGRSTRLVFKFCRQSKFAGLVIPSHGRYVGASSVPIDQYPRKPGERYGLNWLIPLPKNRQVRHVGYDTNYWKSFVHARLAVAMGDRGGLTLYGRNPERHRLLAEHLTAEYSVRTEGRGRTVDEWKAKPNQPDNHWLDCLVGAAVAASMEGVGLPELDQPRRSSAGGGRRERRIWRVKKTG